MHVILVAGGWSNERDVSLSGAKGVGRAIEALGHDLTVVDLSDGFGDLIASARTADFAFINLHGSPGEDGLVQAVLDSVGCPYQGTGPAGSFLALHKAASKSVLRAKGLPTPDWDFLPAPPPGDWRPTVGYPLFAKPNMGGSSVGMRPVRTPGELGPALETIFAMGEEALLEAFVPGREITCSVLDGTPLPLIAIRPLGDSEFFDYTAKYTPQMAEEICPAPIEPGLARRIGELAVAAHEALGLEGYSRADFMVLDGEPTILEVNTLPGMTPTSLLPQAAAEAGLDFENLIARLMELGLARGGKA